MPGNIVEAAMRSKLTIHVDENSYKLIDALRDSGFKVLKVQAGMDDIELSRSFEGDVVLTQNSKDFLSSAVIYDFDVISIERIKFIDDKPDRTNQTAKKISTAIRESEFYLKRGNFLLTIFDDGKWHLKELK